MAKKKGTSNKPADLNGKAIVEKDSAPAAKQPPNRAKLEEAAGSSSVSADGKAPATGRPPDPAASRRRQQHLAGLASCLGMHHALRSGRPHWWLVGPSVCGLVLVLYVWFVCVAWVGCDIPNGTRGTHGVWCPFCCVYGGYICLANKEPVVIWWRTEVTCKMAKLQTYCAYLPRSHPRLHARY
jgi:hypothetical protein